LRSASICSRREIGDALGQVAIRRTVAQQAADLGDDLAEVDVVAPTDHLVARHADVEQRDPPTGPNHTTELLEETR
jgi:hypothetical protein